MGSRGQSRAEPTDLRLPDRYRVRRRLATGGMAAVWCAEDLVLGRTVAVKVLAERFARRRHGHAALQARGPRGGARVHSRPRGHDLRRRRPGGRPRDVESSARPFIVMEYLAGGTVADAIRVGAVRRQEAVRWIREAASALDHAHARGIVHRDIKPANFLLNRSRVLHVADFGIARLVSEDTITSTGELFGTAAYLSPEQALGREATGASDRYALAVAAFELLAGERPFDAPHFAAQARQHIEDERPPASDRDRTLPPAVDDVLDARHGQGARGALRDRRRLRRRPGDGPDRRRRDRPRRGQHRSRRRTAGHVVGAGAMGRNGNGHGNGRSGVRARSASRGTEQLEPPHPRPRPARSGRDGLMDGGEHDPAPHPPRAGAPGGCSPWWRCSWRSGASGRWRCQASAARTIPSATPRRPPKRTATTHAPAAASKPKPTPATPAPAQAAVLDAPPRRPPPRRRRPSSSSSPGTTSCWRATTRRPSRPCARRSRAARPGQHHLRLRPRTTSASRC